MLAKLINAESPAKIAKTMLFFAIKYRSLISKLGTNKKATHKSAAINKNILCILCIMGAKIRNVE